MGEKKYYSPPSWTAHTLAIVPMRFEADSYVERKAWVCLLVSMCADDLFLTELSVLTPSAPTGTLKSGASYIGEKKIGRHEKNHCFPPSYVMHTCRFLQVNLSVMTKESYCRLRKNPQ